jgi:hypothetical protein
MAIISTERVDALIVEDEAMQSGEAETSADG